MATNIPHSDSSDIPLDTANPISSSPHSAEASYDSHEPSDLELGIPPIISRSRAAFLRDLPRLIEERPRDWVAYHGDEQLGFAKTRTELFQECLRRGLKRDEFLVCSIEPQVETITVRPELLG